MVRSIRFKCEFRDNENSGMLMPAILLPKIYCIPYGGREKGIARHYNK